MQSINATWQKLLCFLVLSMCLLRVYCQLQCRDEKNEPVDWYVLYKIPKISESSNSLIKTGVAYAYITSASDSDQWTLSDVSVDSSVSMPGNTLLPLYKHDSDEKIYVLYNDQPPNAKTSFTAGHTKGVVYANKDGGFWLIHSVPHYPPPPSEGDYSYPTSGYKNGQSYLCISLPAKDLEVVGTQLLYNNPKVFGNYSSKTLQSLYPNLTLASWGKEIRKAPWQHEDTLTSLGGTQFLTFAKTSKFNKDLYEDWVASSLEADLLVESWPNGPGRLNSSCESSYKVENVDSIKVPVVGQDFSSNKDHSKWAVAFKKEKPWVCIGDINRAKSQAHRAGGTVCMQKETVWSAYYSAVNNIEECPLPKGFFRRTYEKIKSFWKSIF